MFTSISIALTVLAVAGEPDPVALTRLRAHVATLASPEYGGRRGEVAEKSRQYLIKEFQGLGVKPLFPENSFRQEIAKPDPAGIKGTNVGAFLEGSDPTLKGEWILLGVHFDHLGSRNGVVFPGADDNASGVAMMLEVARRISQGKERPRRSIAFIGFDLEESGLWGSRYFAERSPMPLAKVKLFVTADMLGGALADVCRDDLFALGSENAPGLLGWLETAAKGEPFSLGTFGADMLLIDRSDYGPFRSRSIPFLFFTTGESRRYHRQTDTPASLNYNKLASATRIIERVLRESLDAESVPEWSKAPERSLSEARSIKRVLSTLLDHREELGLKPGQAAMLSQTIATADAAIARGTISAQERATLVRAARVILFTIL